MTTTPGGLLLVLAVLVPFVGVLAAFALGGRNAQRVATVTILAGLGIAIAIAAAMARSGDTLVYLLGGWAPPLGIALRADELSAVMMLAVAVVILGIGVYARADFGTPAGVREARGPFVFWTLLLAIWGALNLVFVSGDLFTLYVALELLTFAAVPLVSLDGRAETLRAALRYLLYALLGSMLYLLGTVLFYGAYGTLDIHVAGQADPSRAGGGGRGSAHDGGAARQDRALPTASLAAACACGRAAAASAVLSALVIKGSFFLVVRLWFDVMPGVVTAPSAQLLAGLGAAAILVGSIVALRQERLKLLVAYSTVAQIGYLFLMFPLAFDVAADALERGAALAGGMLQAISHAMAKAAMFMAAGLIYQALGHDRIAELPVPAVRLPMSVLTFALAGLALMGLPPSGAYSAKKLLLDAADASGQWWWALVLDVGGLLTASYVLLVLAHALWPAAEPVKTRAPVSRLAETAALALALCSLALGLVALGPPPLDALPEPLDPAGLASAILVLLGGAVLAAGLGLKLPPLPTGGALAAAANPARRAAVAVGGTFVRTDGVLRQWPVAGLAVIVAAIAFCAALLARG